MLSIKKQNNNNNKKKTTKKESIHEFLKHDIRPSNPAYLFEEIVPE